MSENPYEKAIEETAKSAGKALDLVKSASPAIGDIYGLMIGDKISERRKRNLDALAVETKKILEDRKVEAKELPEQIGLPLLDAAQSESREELRTRWARLLANAMDPERVGDVRPDFIETMKALEPVDAIVLELAAGKVQNPASTVFQPKDIAKDTELRESQVAVALEKLVEVKCFKNPPNGDRNLFMIAHYGVEFLRACRP